MRSKNLVPVQVILPQSQMGSSNHSEQRGAFEEALQSFIEASLRTSGTAPTLRVFSSLYHRSKPYSGADIRPGADSAAFVHSSLLPPPDNGDAVVDLKPDVADLNRELSRNNRTNDERTSPGDSQSGRTSSAHSTASPRQQRDLQQEGNFSSLPSRGPPPLLVPQGYMRASGAATTTSNSDISAHNNNANRQFLQRFPSLLPQNLKIEQLKQAQEQVKQLQHLQRWHMLQQRHQQARAVVNSLSQMPRLPLFNPLMPPSALNRNALMKPGSAINGAHTLPQQQEPSPTASQSSPGSPMFRKGYCKGGKDVRLSTLQRDGTQIVAYPRDYTLVAMSISPSTPQATKSPGSCHPPDMPSEAMVVVAISITCLPPHQQEPWTLMAQCIGCGETSLHTFATLSSHINLRTASPTHTSISLSGVNPLQRHARNFVLRDNSMPHVFIRGAIVPWQACDVTPPRAPTSGGMLLAGAAPQRPKSSISPQQARPQLKYGGRAINDGRTATRSQLPPAGVSITHRDLVTRTSNSTSRISPILLDSPPANGSLKQQTLPAEWSPISSAGSGQSLPTSDTVVALQNRIDPDWNSTVKLPENLPDYVGCPLILICWEWQQLQSNIPNVHITHSFAKCFEEASSECHASSVTLLSREICYFMTAQYLAMLEKHEFPTPSSLSAWLGRSRLMLTSMRQFQINAANVVALVRMTISNCLHKIGIIISQISQAHAINECIANLRPGGPSYHIVAHINGDTILDLSILMTGHTSRVTREYLQTWNECEEVVRQTFTTDALDKIDQKIEASDINSCVTVLSAELDKLKCFHLTSFAPPLSFTPYNTRPFPEKNLADSRSPSSTSNSPDAVRVSTSDRNNNHRMESVQEIADSLTSHLSSFCIDRSKLDLSQFSSIRFSFILPPSPVIAAETMADVASSGVLQELGICSASTPSTTELHSIIYTAALKSKQRFYTLCERMKKNSSTLFFLFCLDAHLHCDVNSVGSQWVSTLTDEIMGQFRNVVMVSCTHIPHSLLGQNISIPWENVLFPKCKSVNLSFFDHCSSMRNISASITFDPKHDSKSIIVCDGLPEIHSSIINMKLLILDYISSLALAVSSFRTPSDERNSPPNEDVIQSAVSPLTFSIVQNLISSKSGITVLIRVPLENLGARFVSELTDAREKLKMDKAFEIMLYGSHTKPSLSDHFLQVVKTCKQKPDDWIPETLAEIDCIPLLLVYTGKDVTNHIIPNNLRYVDLRLLASDFDSLTQSCILAEMSLVHPTVRMESVSTEKDHEVENCSGPPLKKAKCDSDDDALRMDTFSEDSESEIGNTLQWKSFNGKDQEVEEFSSDEEKRPDSNGRKRKQSDNNSPSGKNVASRTGMREEFTTLLPTVIVSRTMHMYIESYLKGTQAFMELPAHSNCEWVSHARTVVGERLLSNIQTAKYLRKWSRALPSHPNFTSNAQDGEGDHARNFLLVTPPRTRVALSCCLFLKRIYKMLVNLLQVEVHDYKSTSIIKPRYPFSNLNAMPLWPTCASILDMDFDASVANAGGLRASQITNRFKESSITEIRDKDATGTAYCMAGKLSAQDFSHQTCEFCRTPTIHQAATLHEVSILKRGINHQSFCDGTLSLNLIFIIPEANRHWFIWQQRQDGESEVTGLNLRLQDHTGIKTPVFSLGVSGAQYGLYNLDHVMRDPSTQLLTDEGVEGPTDPPMHVVVVKKKDVEEYKTTWPQKVLMVVPETFDDLGMGAMKYAVQCMMQHSVNMRRQGEQENLGQELASLVEIWPFGLLLDDSAVMWTSCAKDDYTTSSAADDTGQQQWRNASLLELLRRIESVPSVERYAAVGIRPWCSHMEVPICEENISGDVVSSEFSKCHLASCYAINVSKTKDEMFDFLKFRHEDIDWFMRISSSDLPVFRFNGIAVATKAISSPFRNEITTISENPQSLVGLADSDHTPIARPPHHLLEEFLAQLGHTVFPKARGDSRHPVLVLDHYVSLGPEVFVEFVSSKPDALPWSVNTEKTYSGLLLYCQSNNISENFLQQFRFVHGATVCVVGRYRNSLRQTVVNLQLENDWHFRLTDEYQTANDTSKGKPLFYLTGISPSPTSRRASLPISDADD